MNITKLGHCCLLIEDQGVRLLIDPGTYSTAQDQLKDIQIVLITHEHADHFHIPSLQKIVANNPKVLVVCNTAVAGLLETEGIAHMLIGDGESKELEGILVEAMEAPHALIYEKLPQVLNTGFFIGEKLFYPGDAWIEPGKPVDVLALPVGGPWVKISDFMDYALKVRPRVAFPVHDGGLVSPGLAYRVPTQFLEQEGIAFVALQAGDVHEF